VADAGPLIALARTGLLPLLQKLYDSVLIPPKVLAELEIDADRPGSKVLRKALHEGWLACAAVAPSEEIERIQQLVDAGEAEAIALCEQHAVAFFSWTTGAGAAWRGAAVSASSAPAAFSSWPRSMAYSIGSPRLSTVLPQSATACRRNCETRSSSSQTRFDQLAPWLKVADAVDERLPSGIPIFTYHPKRVTPRTESKWSSRLTTDCSCCSASAAIHTSFSGIDLPRVRSSSLTCE
jgi:hypothetical protein